MQPSAAQPHNNADETALSVGTHVEHSRFGLGVVEQIQGSGLDTKATVRFNNVGTKVLLLRFAKLRVVE